MRFKLRNIIETDLLESRFDYKYKHSNTIHEVNYNLNHEPWDTSTLPLADIFLISVDIRLIDLKPFSHYVNL